MLQQVVLFFIIVSSFPLTASAQDDATVARAREHFSRGEMAFHQERWLDCATHFESSFQAIFAPELLYNIGLCYERVADTMGDEDSIPYMERALSAYTRYLRELPQASDAAAIQIRVADLRLLLDRARAAVEPDPDLLSHDIVVTTEPEPPTVLVGDPESIVEEPVREPAVDRGFGFGWTTASGALTLASFVAAIAFSVAAQDQFNNLASTCGRTTTGCSQADVASVTDLVAGANVMYVASGILLAATGLSFGLEFHFWSTSSGTQASLGYSGTF